MEVKALLYLPEGNGFGKAGWEGRVKGKSEIDTCNKGPAQSDTPGQLGRETGNRMMPNEAMLRSKDITSQQQLSTKQ